MGEGTAVETKLQNVSLSSQTLGLRSLNTHIYLCSLPKAHSDGTKEIKKSLHP